jgi:hypothetical protein
MRLHRVSILAVVSAIAVSGPALAQVVADPGLFEAIRTSRSELLIAFLDRGGDPNSVIPASPMGNVSLLRVAVAGNREDIVLALLQAGARFDLSGSRLRDVGAAGMDRALEYLLENQSPKDLAEVESALDITVQLGHYDSVVVLLKYINEDELRIEGLAQDAIYLAFGKDDIARLLLDNGAPASSAALRAAAQWSSPGMMRYLLQLGANPFERYRDSVRGSLSPRDGFTAIDFVWDSYLNGSPAQKIAATFKLHDLLALGATSEKVDASLAADIREILPPFASPATRLRAAAQSGFYDIVKEILDDPAGRDPIAMRTATIVALRSHWDDIARLLLDEGAPPDGGPLHVAVRSSSPGMVRHILELGADPNEPLDGYTPSQYWFSDNPAVPVPPGGRISTNSENLHELIRGGADVCHLLAYRDQLADQPFSYDVLWNSASECWPEQQ